MGGVKDQTISLFKSKDYKPTRTCQNCVLRWKKTNQIKNTKAIWRQHNQKHEKSFSTKKNKAIKDSDIKTLFEQQEKDYYKLLKDSVIFGIIIILNMKAVAIETKTYQWQNTLTKLNPTWEI